MPSPLVPYIDWPNVESDRNAWLQWAEAPPTAWKSLFNKEQAMTAAHPAAHPASRVHDDVYASQLVETLSDVVEILNEAKADGTVFQFQIGQVAPDGNYALTSLTATRPIVVMPPPNVGVVGEPKTGPANGDTKASS